MVNSNGFDRGLRGWRGYGNGKGESGTQELRKTPTDSSTDFPARQSHNRRRTWPHRSARGAEKVRIMALVILVPIFPCAFCAFLRLGHFERSGVYDPQIAHIAQMQVMDVRGGEAGGSISGFDAYGVS